MKTLILFGSGEVGKRAEALKIRGKFGPEDQLIVDLKQSAVKDLVLSMSSKSFFAEARRLVVVENTPDSLDLEQINQSDENLFLLLIAQQPKSDSILLKTAKTIQAKVMSFEGARELNAFPFLDSLIEQKKESLAELSKLLQEYGGMYVLTMIYYLLRRNFLPLPASSFMKDKISRQKRKMNEGDWLKFYRLVLEAEYSIKNGVLTENLALNSLVFTVISNRF